MAKATVLNPPPPPVIVLPKPSYRLSLTQEEFELLYAILYKVGGDPTRSSRKYSEAILNAIREVATDKGGPYNNEFVNFDKFSGSIFVDND